MTKKNVRVRKDILLYIINTKRELKKSGKKKMELLTEKRDESLQISF